MLKRFQLGPYTITTEIGLSHISNVDKTSPKVRRNSFINFRRFRDSRFIVEHLRCVLWNTKMFDHQRQDIFTTTTDVRTDLNPLTDLSRCIQWSY